MYQVKTISSDVLLSSKLLSADDSCILSIELEKRLRLTATDVIGIDLPARNRVEALLNKEFLEEIQLRELACEFAEHTLYVFESDYLGDTRLRRMVDVAKLYYTDGANHEQLQAAFVEAWHAIKRFTCDVYQSAFASGLAATLLYEGEAETMARSVALWSQNAVHRREWEQRKSDFKPILGREKEATWQLKCIKARITE